MVSVSVDPPTSPASEVGVGVGVGVREGGTNDGTDGGFAVPELGTAPDHRRRLRSRGHTPRFPTRTTIPPRWRDRNPMFTRSGSAPLCCSSSLRPRRVQALCLWDVCVHICEEGEAVDGVGHERNGCRVVEVGGGERLVGVVPEYVVCVLRSGR
jgi:hypothetical protein